MKGIRVLREQPSSPWQSEAELLLFVRGLDVSISSVHSASSSSVSKAAYRTDTLTEERTGGRRTSATTGFFFVRRNLLLKSAVVRVSPVFSFEMSTTVSAHPSLSTRPKVFESKLKTTNWGQTFPVDLQTRETSLKLVKKLVAVGVSTVLYLRSNIPESAFNKCEVDGLNLRILNAASDSRPAQQITSRVRNAVEAIEKGYLARLTLAIYKESQRAEDAHETYNFDFEYMGSDKAPRMAFLSKADLFQEENAIFSDTRHMFRRIILLTQHLPPLPLGMYITILLTYNDEAPEDYNPPGYTTGNLEFKVEKETEPSVMGTVTSRHHKLQTKVHSRDLMDYESPSSDQKVEARAKKRPRDANISSQGSVPPSPSSKVALLVATQLTSGLEPGAKSILSNTQPSQDLSHRIETNRDAINVVSASWEPELLGSDVPQTPVRPNKRPRGATVMASEVKDDPPQEI